MKHELDNKTILKVLFVVLIFGLALNFGGCCSAPRKHYANNWVWHPDMSTTSNW